MPRRVSTMSGTSKAIVSICVLLLASLVVYYGMTPPQSGIAVSTEVVPTRPSMFGGEGNLQKLVSLGYPPIAADITQEQEEVAVEVETIEESTEDTVAPVEEVVPITPEPVQVEEIITKLYTVRDGETLGEIASRELGSFRMWIEIANLNGISDPSSILPGRTLRMPDSRTKTTKKDELAPHASLFNVHRHSVTEGETFSSIAGDYYDDANKYYVIVGANPSVNPNRLRIGQILHIPTQ